MIVPLTQFWKFSSIIWPSNNETKETLPYQDSDDDFIERLSFKKKFDFLIAINIIPQFSYILR